eukprot:9248-Heterococcus_DN1.PRE.1
MNIISYDTLITNVEAYEFLKRRKEPTVKPPAAAKAPKSNKRGRADETPEAAADEAPKVQPRPWIEYAVLNYLRPLVGTRTEEDVRKFWAIMSKHPALRNLTRAERLHIVNLRPHSDAAVYPLIED